MLFQIPTPIQEINLKIHNPNNIRLFIKREDLIHRIVSGNKWRKLKYNFEHVVNYKIDTILSFGGAYSNHLHALSWLANLRNIKSIGIVRGDPSYRNNPTLSFCVKNKMDLHFLSRKLYRESKFDNEVINKLKKKHEKIFIIPEGGFNNFGIKGCREIMNEVDENFDTICCSIGSGCTAVGLIQTLKDHQNFLGFSSFKNSKLLEDVISKNTSSKINWKINCDYNFGGFGKVNTDLIKFIDSFAQLYKIELDPVYTSKLFFGLFDMISKKKIKKESRILVIHTGGLQGLQGINK